MPFQLRYGAAGNVAATRAQLSALLTDLPKAKPIAGAVPTPVHAANASTRGRLVRSSSFNSSRDKGTSESLAHLQEARNQMLQLQLKRTLYLT